MHRFLFFFSFVSHANQIAECTLAPFVSGSTSEKIPFVFLPLHGQIIHPSKEINFQGKCYARLATVWVQRACRCPWNDNLTFSSSLSWSNQNSWCIILSFKNLFALPASRIRENYKLILSEQQEEDWLSQLSVSQPDTAEMDKRYLFLIPLIFLSLYLSFARSHCWSFIECVSPHRQTYT